MSLGKRDYTESTDIYSLGLIFLVVLNNQLVKNYEVRVLTFMELRQGIDQKEAFARATRAIRDENLLGVPIIEKMLSRDPTNRLNSIEVKQKFEQYSSTAVKNMIARLGPPRNAAFDWSNPCKEFSGRGPEIEEFLSFWKKSVVVNGLKLVSLRGPRTCGKSQLARKLGLELGGTRMWIDCHDMENAIDHVTNRACGKSPWIMVFDDLQKYSVTYFKIVASQFHQYAETNDCSIIVIVTSTKSDIKLDWDLVMELDYSWVDICIDEKLGNLGQLMTQVLKLELTSDQQISIQLCEAFGFLPFTRQHIESAFKLILLISHLDLTGSARVPQRAFTLFLQHFAQHEEICDTVFSAFLKSGVLLVSSLTGFVSSVEELKLKSLGYDSESNYVFVLCSKLVTEKVLTHPCVTHVYENVLQIELQEVKVFDKFLEILTELFAREQDAVLRYNLESCFYEVFPKILRYYVLIRKYIELVADFTKTDDSIVSLQTLKAAYAAVNRVFGENDVNSLAVAENLSDRYYDQHNFLECLKIQEKVYAICKKEFGRSGDRTVKAGNYYGECLDFLGKSSVDIRQEVYDSCEAELGAGDEKTVKAGAELKDALKKAEFYGGIRN